MWTLLSYSFERMGKKVGNILFVVFFLAVMIDPTNTIFHKKEVIFCLLVAYNVLFVKPDFSKLPYILLLFCAVGSSYLLSVVRMIPHDTDEVLAQFKAISPTILLLWVSQYDLVRLAKGPVVFCCCLTTILYILVVSNPIFEGAIWTFMTNHEDTILVSRRSFLGIHMLAFYLKSYVSFLFVFAYYMYRVISKKNMRFYHICILAIMMFAFLTSGTRSTMLVPFFLLIIVAYTVYKKTNYMKFIMIPCTIVLAFVFLAVLIAAISETGEASNVIKYAHLTSYAQLFEEHPSYLLFGQGPGTSFYAEGFNKVVYQTEWTYLELIRNYGILCLVIVFVFVKPLITLWKYRNTHDFTFCMFWTYLAYLLIAGTNPLLMSSTGMATLIMAYSYEHLAKQQTLCTKEEKV